MNNNTLKKIREYNKYMNELKINKYNFLVVLPLLTKNMNIDVCKYTKKFIY